MKTYRPQWAPAPIVGIVGWKDSGKTTLVERLVEIFSGLGLNVATIKHAHHTFDIDHAGTDSARHRAAGAQQLMGFVSIGTPECEPKPRPVPPLSDHFSDWPA